MTTFLRMQELEHEIGAHGRFSIRVTSPDVELLGVTGTTARVRIEFEIRAGSDAEADEALEQVRYVVRASADSLEIMEPKRSDQGFAAIRSLLGRGDLRVETRVRVEVPAGTSVIYNGVSGDLIIRSIIGGLTVQTVSGDLVLSDVAGDLGLTAVSGDVAIRADAPIALTANTVSGDLSVIAPRIDSSHLVTVSGDVELEGDLRPEATHRIETVSGDLAIGAVGGMTLEVRGLSTDVNVNVAHRSEGSRDRRRYVIGDGAAAVQFSSMSGDVSVRMARRVAATVTSPSPPTPPMPPTPATPATPATPVTPAAPATPAMEAEPADRARPVDESAQLEILRALERGEIDIDEAQRRLGGEVNGG